MEGILASAWLGCKYKNQSSRMKLGAQEATLRQSIEKPCEITVNAQTDMPMAPRAGRHVLAQKVWPTPPHRACQQAMRGHPPRSEGRGWPGMSQPKKKHNLIRPVEQDGIGCAKEGN